MASVLPSLRTGFEGGKVPIRYAWVDPPWRCSTGRPALHPGGASEGLWSAGRLCRPMFRAAGLHAGQPASRESNCPRNHDGAWTNRQKSEIYKTQSESTDFNGR